MKRNPIFLTIISTIILVASCFILFRDTQAKRIPVPPVSPGMTLYYREDCPHCKIVEAYIADHHLEDNIIISHKEVMQNTANATELMAYAKECGIDTSTVGVPFLWDGKSCHVGDKDIVAYFDEQTNPIHE